jgi:hypothetical protein
MTPRMRILLGIVTLLAVLNAWRWWVKAPAKRPAARFEIAEILQAPAETFSRPGRDVSRYGSGDGLAKPRRVPRPTPTPQTFAVGPTPVPVVADMPFVQLQAIVVDKNERRALVVTGQGAIQVEAGSALDDGWTVSEISEDKVTLVQPASGRSRILSMRNE